MSVYKEGFYLIEFIEKKSKQIYDDAADYGAPVVKDDSVWNAMKQLSDWYGEKSTKKVDNYSTGTTASIEIHLLDEWNTKKPVNYKMTYVTTRDHKEYDGYVYVERI